MGGFEWKRNSAGDLVRVPRDRGQRVVTLDAGVVRAPQRVQYTSRGGGRAAEFQDGRHQAATGTGRRTAARGGSSDKN